MANGSTASCSPPYCFDWSIENFLSNPLSTQTCSPRFFVPYDKSIWSVVVHHSHTNDNGVEYIGAFLYLHYIGDENINNNNNAIEAEYSIAVKNANGCAKYIGQSSNTTIFLRNGIGHGFECLAPRSFISDELITSQGNVHFENKVKFALTLKVFQAVNSNGDLTLNERQLQREMANLKHASTCKDLTCQYQPCNAMKYLQWHQAQCDVKTLGCFQCDYFDEILRLHYDSCRNQYCCVAKCKQMRSERRMNQEQQNVECEL